MEEELSINDRKKELINIALRYLCLREYSENELRLKIKTKQQFTEEEFQQAFSELKEKNYLNEDRYLRQKANILKIKGFSTHYILQFLNKENIQTTKKEIENLGFKTDQEIIESLILKKYSTEELIELPIKKMNNLIRNICTKGHSYSEVKSIIKSLQNSL